LNGEQSLLEALHVRLLQDDPTASGDLAQLVLFGPLAGPFLLGLRWRAGPLLRSVGNTVRDDALHDAAVTACIGYMKRPAQYDPAKAPGGLLQYLIMAAHRDLLNARRGIERQGEAEPLSLVELRAQRRNTQLRLVGVGSASQESNPEETLDAQQRAAELRAQLAAQEALMATEAERMVLRLMASGERDTTVFAQALGIGALPPDAQQREVKRVKDKIKKRLERAGLRATWGASYG
jgi:hypothetical protein